MSIWHRPTPQRRDEAPRVPVVHTSAAHLPHDAGLHGLIVAALGLVGIAVTLLLAASPVAVTAGLIVSVVVVAVGWESLNLPGQPPNDRR